MLILSKYLSFSSGRHIINNVNWNLLRMFQPSTLTAGISQMKLESKHQLPPKPKRPLTPYFKFLVQIRPEVKEKNPTASLTDIVRIIAQRWEQIEPQLKEKLETDYKNEQEIYAKERLNYDTQLTDEQKELIKQLRAQRVEDKKKREYKKKCSDNNKPKKPSSAFVLYFKTRLADRGTIELKEFMKSIATDWNSLTDLEKQPFVKQMQDEMVVYQTNLAKWENSMIKLGHTDIVRQSTLDPKPKKTKLKTK